MHEPPALYLASASPRRLELLRQIGLRCTLLAAGDDEDAEALETPLRGEAAAAYVARVTEAKLDAALQRLRRRALAAAPVLCADTTVVVDRRILGKPGDAAQARAMLRSLSARRHRVLSAVAVAWPDRQGRWQRAATLQQSVVRMATLNEAAIDAYVASGEPFGKAGGYAVQGRAATFIEDIRGSYSGIMGLPLFETAALLRQAGLSI